MNKAGKHAAVAEAAVAEVAVEALGVLAEEAATLLGKLMKAMEPKGGEDG